MEPKAMVMDMMATSPLIQATTQTMLTVLSVRVIDVASRSQVALQLRKR